MGLTIIKKSRRNNTYEMMVWQALSQYREIEISTLSIFTTNFWSDIQSLPRLSVGSPSDFYQLIKHPIGVRDYEEPSSVELWHNDVKGNPDRLVAIITMST